MALGDESRATVYIVSVINLLFVLLARSAQGNAEGWSGYNAWDRMFTIFVFLSL